MVVRILDPLSRQWIPSCVLTEDTEIILLTAVDSEVTGHVPVVVIKEVESRIDINHLVKL